MFASFFSFSGASVADNHNRQFCTNLPILCAHLVEDLEPGANHDSVNFEDFVVFAGNRHVGELIRAQCTVWGLDNQTVKSLVLVVGVCSPCDAFLQGRALVVGCHLVWCGR